MGKPFVSVLIDTYNHERFIEQAIVSVIEQKFPASDREILVVDDGSTDRTPEIVRKFEPQVRLLRKANGGQASAFNVGIPECKGEIVAFLDGDDWWKPNKLAIVSAAMESDPKIGIVGNGIVIVQPDGTEESESLRQGNRFCANTPAGAKSLIVRGSFLGTSRMTIRSRVLTQIGPIPETIVFEADEYLFTLAAVLHDALILPDVLSYYRLHNSNLYQIMRPDPERSRRKQKVLEQLANSLTKKLAALNANPRAARIITNNLKADADFWRLTLDGGMPWETLRTEWRLYQQVYDIASPLHRIFRFLTLLPVFFLPSRFYYSLKRNVAQSSFYQRMRRQWLPNPSHGHVLRAAKIEEPQQKNALGSGHSSN